jgi:hypothetical protein
LPLFLHTFQSSGAVPCHQVFDADVVDSILQLVLNCGALPGSLGGDKPEAGLGAGLQRSISLQGADDADVGGSFTVATASSSTPAASAGADSAAAGKRLVPPLGQVIMQSTSDALRIEMLKVISLLLPRI